MGSQEEVEEGEKMGEHSGRRREWYDDQKGPRPRPCPPRTPKKRGCCSVDRILKGGDEARAVFAGPPTPPEDARTNPQSLTAWYVDRHRARPNET